MWKTYFNVEESIIIKASTKKVWENILLYKNQITWSPWEILDNKCKVKIDGKDGTVESLYKWNGPLVGEGEMQHKEIKKNEYVKSDIRFVKPFKSEAETYFKLEKTKKKGEIKVVWGMNGNLPFFLFWMKSMMTLFVSKDYQRGLKMLKILSETGKLETSTQNKGRAKAKAFYWIGIQKTKPLAKIGDTMEKDFKKLGELLEKKGIQPKKALAFYPKVDMKQNIFTFISSFEISEKDFENLEIPSKYVKGHFPGSQSLKVIHKGSYDFLTNSWSSLYMGIKPHKAKVNKQLSSFEIYTKNAMDGTEEKDLVTELYLPIKN